MPSLMSSDCSQVGDHEDVEDRAEEQHDRRHHAEEQEGDVGRVAAIAGHDQLVARSFLRQPFGQVEVVRPTLETQLLRCLAQRSLFRFGKTLALARRGSVRARWRPPSCAWRALSPANSGVTTCRRSALAAMAARNMVMNRLSSILIDEELNHRCTVRTRS